MVVGQSCCQGVNGLAVPRRCKSRLESIRDNYDVDDVVPPPPYLTTIISHLYAEESSPIVKVHGTSSWSTGRQWSALPLSKRTTTAFTHRPRWSTRRIVWSSSSTRRRSTWRPKTLHGNACHWRTHEQIAPWESTPATGSGGGRSRSAWRISWCRCQPTPFISAAGSRSARRISWCRWGRCGYWSKVQFAKQFIQSNSTHNGQQ